MTLCIVTSNGREPGCASRLAASARSQLQNVVNTLTGRFTPGLTDPRLTEEAHTGDQGRARDVT